MLLPQGLWRPSTVERSTRGVTGLYCSPRCAIERDKGLFLPVASKSPASSPALSDRPAGRNGLAPHTAQAPLQHCTVDARLQKPSARPITGRGSAACRLYILFPHLCVLRTHPTQRPQGTHADQAPRAHCRTADKFVANNNAFLIYRFLSRATVELTHQRQCPFVEQIVEAENQGNP